ncbi:zf-HC2 domain-containing protein [Thermoflexus sp.]|uniref:zf-HC2 domain-containing protein n=1 Tax=Thermoflexus sp. TaxID=1969742 RepID=UPI0017641F74|nr:zf-HC2 domain-containing protein [Thermoflexus sp.]
MPFFQLKADEHQWVQDRLSLYLDDRLEPEERARVEAHLRGCETCARSWETLRWTVQAIRALPPVRAPRSFAIRPEQVASASPGAGWLRRAAWAMAAALILVLGLDLALSRGAAGPQPAMAPAGAPATEAERQALRALKDHTFTPSPAPMFGLIVPQPTPTETAERRPGAEEAPPPAPAPPLPPLRILEFLLLLGAIGSLALDRWRSGRLR